MVALIHFSFSFLDRCKVSLFEVLNTLLICVSIFGQRTKSIHVTQTVPNTVLFCWRTYIASLTFKKKKKERERKYNLISA